MKRTINYLTMKKANYLFLLLAMMLMAACNGNNSQTEKSEYELDTVNYCCTDPVCVLMVQPYDDFSQTEAKQLANKVKTEIERMTAVMINEVHVLPNKPLPESALNDAKTRYRAEKILKLQQPQCKGFVLVMGLTNSDISTANRGHDDWGIQGLAYMGAKNCVVSPFRLPKRNQLWKLACHEFIHAYCNWPHCPKDNPKCIMQDGHGKPNFAIKNSLCEYCKNILG